ncbi:hypothetical protein [Pseudomonas brassicae]|uniref:hypothetical protein n=1 Tax=Pseudomonas brassicae TaxID=2708063 RepID=UPI001FB28639|nr:hypothetical protein [Pseudomonas brassicae]
MPTLNRPVLYYLAIAVVQALLLSSGLFYRQPVLAAFTSTLALVGGLNLQLLGHQLRQRGTWLLAGALALLMAACPRGCTPRTSATGYGCAGCPRPL